MAKVKGRQTKPEAHQRRLRAVASCVRGFVVEADADGRCLDLWVDDPTLLPVDRASVVGCSIDGLLGPAGPPLADVVRRVVRTGEPERVEIALERDNGQRWLVLEVAHTGGARGVAIVVARDVSEQRMAEQQLRASEAERHAAIGVLVAGVCHEINNPLAYVLGNVEFALTTGPFASEPEARAREEEARVALNEARDGARRIAEIVRSLKLFQESSPRGSRRG